MGGNDVWKLVGLVGLVCQVGVVLFGLVGLVLFGLDWFGRLIFITSPKEIIHVFFHSYYPCRLI